MEREDKKKIQIVVIVAIVLLIIVGVLSLIFKNNKNDDKVLRVKDYVIEKETTYTEKNGKMPIINLKGEDIEKINSEIMTKYYSVVHNEYDEFKYEYTTYKDILSMLIVVTYANETEYGKIEYYAYNINLKESKVLTTQELYEYLKVDTTKIDEEINLKHKDFYDKDELKNEISYEEYLEAINYKKENDKVIIKNNALYKYNVLTLTQSLMSYPGNINEIKLIELK